MRAKIKIIIDIGMIILVLLQMAYHLVGDSLHGWLGTMLFVLLILHNIIDRKWYLGLCKGKYTPVRFFHTAINLLLLVSFLCLAVSAVFLSSTLSAFFNLRVAMLGRRIHMVFTTWGFILMSAHVGLHWNIVFGTMKKQIKGIQYLYKSIILLVSVYGLYAFIIRELPQRMFLLSEYVFFDYGESIVFLIMDYIAIMCLFASITYWIKRLMSKKKTEHSGSDF